MLEPELKRFDRNQVKRVLLQENLKGQVMDAVYDQMGHIATEKTLALSRVRCFWSCMVQMWSHLAGLARNAC